jgi:hypothetical protein
LVDPLFKNETKFSNRILANNFLNSIFEIRNDRNRICAGRAGKGPVCTRADIKHPFLLAVDRDPDIGNIRQKSGIGHNLEMD